MGQQAAVTLNTVVYSPAGSSNGTARWVNRSAGVSSGFSVLTENVKDPVTGSQVKISFGLDVPVVATTDDACACTGQQLRSATVNISVWEATTSTATERADIWQRIVDLVNSTPFSDAVKNLDPAFG